MTVISKRKRRAMFAKCDGHCFYCGRVLYLLENQNRDWLQIDRDHRMVPEHLTPRERGGSNEDTNLVSSCQYCNSAKGSLTLAEYRLWVSLRQGDVAFTFAGEPKRQRRDFLNVFSEKSIRPIFNATLPASADKFKRNHMKPW